MKSPYDIETIKLIDGKISHKRHIHPLNEFNYNCISILINLNNIKNASKHDLVTVKGISEKIALEIKKNLR